ncbi:MAG: cation-translocating P-type ATPase [Planctomycetota bacterium]
MSQVTSGLTTHGTHNSGSIIEGSAHHEVNLEKWIVAYLVGGLLVFTTTITRIFGLASEEIAQIPAFLGAILLGLGLFYAAAKEVLRGRPTSSSLAALAVIAAIAIGRYEAAGYVAFILLVFDHALRRTAWGARRAIEELVGLTPDTARLVEEDGSEREVSLSEIVVGQVVRVRAGENLPVDGEVTSGRSSVNQASLTGEALPVEVEPGAQVYAGTTNLTGNLDLRATSVGEDTTIGKVATLIEAAESAKTPRQLLIELVARYFVPIAIVVSALVWYFTKDVETAITVLVVCCPAALLISSPTAMMAAFAAAARLGIMIKQTSYLEAAGEVDTVVFDKTGTLTTGRFAVSRLAPADGVEGADLLKAAATAEQHSNHPLARSIMETATQARVTPESGTHHEEVHGKGVKVSSSEGELAAGRSSWLLELNPGIRPSVEAVEQKIEGMTGVHVMRGDRYLGAVGLEDKLRHNAKTVIEQIRELGARSIHLLTGDRFAVAKRVGVTVDVDQIEAERLPEEKHATIIGMVASGKRVLMVGDGINDGPSLAAADVGVAMGLSGSDIATNSAGIALMTDDIGRIPFLMQLARKTRIVIAQNIVASIVVALAGLVLAASGSISLWLAVVYHFVGDIFVIANSFRLIRFGEDFRAHERQAVMPTSSSTPSAPPSEPSSPSPLQAATA